MTTEIIHNHNEFTDQESSNNDDVIKIISVHNGNFNGYSSFSTGLTNSEEDHNTIIDMGEDNSRNGLLKSDTRLIHKGGCSTNSHFPSSSKNKGNTKKKSSERRDIPLTDKQKQFIRTKFVRQGYCRNMCTFCNTIVHNDHVARWASHFRACSKIPMADRAEYNCYADNIESTIPSDNHNHKRRRVSVKKEEEVSNVDPMDLLFRAAVSGTNNIFSVTPTADSKTRETATVKEGRISSSSWMTEDYIEVNGGGELYNDCSKAFSEGLESGILLFDKFSRLMIEKLASKVGADNNITGYLAIFKDELNKHFAEVLTENGGNFDKFNAANIIDNLIANM